MDIRKIIEEKCDITIESIELIGEGYDSKAYIIGLTKTIAKELAPKGIRCNAIAPGFISTDMTENQKENPLLRMIPLGRFGAASDVADAAAYLAQANYVTGEVLRVDGGIVM